MPDHVYMLISIPPKYSVTQIIGYMKATSAMKPLMRRQAAQTNPDDPGLPSRGRCDRPRWVHGEGLLVQPASRRQWGMRCSRLLRLVFPGCAGAGAVLPRKSLFLAPAKPLIACAKLPQA